MLKRKLRNYLLSLTISFALVIIIIGILFIFNANQVSLSEFFDVLPNIIIQLISRPLFWLILSLPYLLILLIKFWIQGYRRGGFSKFGRRFSYSFIAPIFIIFLLAKVSTWYQTSEDFNYEWDQNAFNFSGISNQAHQKDGKVRGMHVFGTRNLDSLELRKLTEGNIEHVILVPYADQKDYNVPLSKLSENRVHRRDSVYSQIIDFCKKSGIQVIVKPHVWIYDPSDGKWRGDIWMESEKDWQQWETNYTEFILTNARLSEKFNLPFFCIGNEFYLSTTRRPDYWKSLIKKVRKVYSGKLIYGANWDREYREIEFWNELDYIGIQAYFPLVDQEYPEYEQVRDGWNTHLKEIQLVAEKFNKQVIFTELGYKSTPDAAQYPWEWENYAENQFQPISNKTQVYCYQAFFEKVWNQKWFAGAMIWQWHSRDDGKTANHNFTPKGKPAFNEIARGFLSTR